MRLFFIGCEYAGTTTLANAIHQWGRERYNIQFSSIHDHWKIPHTIGHPPELTDEEQQQVLALSKRIIEANQRHNLYYHAPSQPEDGDFMIIGYYIEDTIYAQLYYGYGGVDEAGDRIVHSKQLEKRLLKYTPQTVLILVKAAPEIIAMRMRTNPHQHSLVPEQDIELVLRRFEEAYEKSNLQHKFTLDTSTATVAETLAEFVEKIQPHLTPADRQRMTQ